MTRAAASLVALLLLVACQPTGMPMVINTHCGLGYVTIEYEGRLWKFADAGDSGQPPAGWHEIDTTYLNEVDGEPIARGPDGKDWRLVERLDQPPAGCI